MLCHFGSSWTRHREELGSFVYQLGQNGRILTLMLGVDVNTILIVVAYYTVVLLHKVPDILCDFCVRDVETDQSVWYCWH